MSHHFWIAFFRQGVGERKKPPETVVVNAETEVKVQLPRSGEALSEPIDAGTAIPLTKPKRARRVGEPKPQRYPVGEPLAEPTYDERQDAGGTRA